MQTQKNKWTKQKSEEAKLVKEGNANKHGTQIHQQTQIPGWLPKQI